jgi:hypothetical protein
MDIDGLFYILQELWITSDTHDLPIGSEVLTTVIMKSALFWDVTQCGPIEVQLTF